MEVVNGIKSKERVKDNGEVFTPSSTVEEMIDLVNDEAGGEFIGKVETSVLEPSCGNGNFLVAIIARKLKTLNDIDNQEEYEKGMMEAFFNTYGIDIMPDNIFESKERMITVAKEAYNSKLKCDMPGWLEKNIRYIMDHNIVIGDAIAGVMVRFDRIAGLGNSSIKPEFDTRLELPKWKFNGDNIRRTMHILLSDPGIDDEVKYGYTDINYKILYSQVELYEEEDEEI